MELTQYIQGELLVLIPVLYALGMFFKKSGSINDRFIPLLLGASGIVLAVIYCIGKSGFSAEAIFTGIVQGILVAASAVYSNQVYRQVTKGE